MDTLVHCTGKSTALAATARRLRFVHLTLNLASEDQFVGRLNSTRRSRGSDLEFAACNTSGNLPSNIGRLSIAEGLPQSACCRGRGHVGDIYHNCFRLEQSIDESPNQCTQIITSHGWKVEVEAASAGYTRERNTGLDGLRAALGRCVSSCLAIITSLLN